MKFSDIELLKYSDMNLLTYLELEGDPKSKSRKKKGYATIYKSNETDFSHNGLGVLDNAKSCYIIEELNGNYYLEMEYPKDKTRKYMHIQPLNILKADGQLFRIPSQTNIQDSEIKIKVTAQHIFYDLLYEFNEDRRVVSKKINEALNILLECNPKFNVEESDIFTTSNANFIMENPVNSIFNKILPRWGGELVRDNFNVTIKQRLGKITNINVIYGKNIVGFEQFIDYSNLATRIYPVGKDGITIETINGGKKYLDSPRIERYPIIFNKEIKFQNIENVYELKGESERLWGIIDLPRITFKVKLFDLANAKEYELLSSFLKLRLGDTVTIYHKPFNINLSARVIKIKKNILTGNIEELELGQFLPTIFNKINNIEDKVTETSYFLQETQGKLTVADQTIDGIIAELATKVTEEEVNNILNVLLEDKNYSTNVELDNLNNKINKCLTKTLNRIKLGVDI